MAVRKQPESNVPISNVKSLLQSFVLILLLSNILVYQLSRHPNDIDHATITAAAAMPTTEVIPLPSLRKPDSEEGQRDRHIYGGEGDPSHLGGFTALDRDGISPAVWKDMISYLGIKSLLDVGCGKGVSTLWFQMHGVDAKCVEGSTDALQHSLLNSSTIIEHDYSRGAWYPSHTVDAVWSVEFLGKSGRRTLSLVVFFSATVN